MQTWSRPRYGCSSCRGPWFSVVRCIGQAGRRDPLEVGKADRAGPAGSNWKKDQNILWIFNPGNNDCQGNPCCRSLSPILRPLSRIPNPSNTLYYEENVGRYAFWADPQGLPGQSCGTTPFPGAIVHGWHPCRGQGGKGDWTYNVCFADAHAGAVKMKGTQNPRLSHYPSCPPNSTPEQCYQNWHCVIVRGSGYQRDTLPSPDVVTDLPCSSVRGDVD